MGCIQALKCNTNERPTGRATQNKALQDGFDPADKTNRVYHFHSKTVQAAAESVGTIGHETFSDVTGQLD
jgi:glutamate synthase domain-containing protein 2